MIHHAGATAASAWVLALVVAGYTLVALWTALCDPFHTDGIGEAGTWLTGFLLLHTLAFTSWDLYCRIVAALVVLFLVGAGLASASRRAGPDVDLVRLPAG